MRKRGGLDRGTKGCSLNKRGSEQSIIQEMEGTIEGGFGEAALEAY